MSEQTDVREMASLLAMLETAADPDQAAMMSPYAIAGMAHRAAAALERMEKLGDALERICRNDIGASFDQRYVEERVRDFASWERGFSDALSIVQRIAGRALATPAPAGQTGGAE